MGRLRNHPEPLPCASRSPLLVLRKVQRTVRLGLSPRGKGRRGSLLRFLQDLPPLPLDSFLLGDALLLSAGVGAGYALILSRHWNVELEGSLGYMYVKGDEYDYYDREAGPLLRGSIFDYAGPTALRVNIVYLF